MNLKRLITATRDFFESISFSPTASSVSPSNDICGRSIEASVTDPDVAKLSSVETSCIDWGIVVEAPSSPKPEWSPPPTPRVAFPASTEKAVKACSSLRMQANESYSRIPFPSVHRQGSVWSLDSEKASASHGSEHVDVHEDTVLEPPPSPSSDSDDLVPESPPPSPPTSRSPSPTTCPDATVKPIGPFKFAQFIQRGSYGNAFAVRDMSRNRVLCMKVFEKAYVGQTGLIRGLKAEVSAYKRIASFDRIDPFIMECHGVFQDELSVYLVMDLMDTDMTSILTREQQGGRTKRWIAQAALGINALHKMGIIHRDIKPENLLIDRAGKLRITDFGSAYVHHEPLTRGAVYCFKAVGTDGYLAPEIRDRKEYGLAVDYWALGCTMFDLIIGEILFKYDEDLTSYRTWNAQRKGFSYVAEAANMELTDQEEDVMCGLLELNPETRFTIDDLWDHPYFSKGRGRTVFNELTYNAKASRHDTDDRFTWDDEEVPNWLVKPKRDMGASDVHGTYVKETVQDLDGHIPLIPPSDFLP